MTGRNLGPAVTSGAHPHQLSAPLWTAACAQRSAARWRPPDADGLARGRGRAVAAAGEPAGGQLARAGRRGRQAHEPGRHLDAAAHACTRRQQEHPVVARPAHQRAAPAAYAGREHGPHAERHQTARRHRRHPPWIQRPPTHPRPWCRELGTADATDSEQQACRPPRAPLSRRSLCPLRAPPSPPAPPTPRNGLPLRFPLPHLSRERVLGAAAASGATQRRQDARFARAAHRVRRASLPTPTPTRSPLRLQQPRRAPLRHPSRASIPT